VRHEGHAAPVTQTLVPPAVAARHPHQKRRRPSNKESEARSPSPGRHSLRSLRTGGKPTGCSSGVGVKRHPPAFSRFSTSGSWRHGDRLAGGSLRCLLTTIADELVGRSMAASPGNRRFGSGGTAPGHVDKPPPGRRLGPKWALVGQCEQVPVIARGSSWIPGWWRSGRDGIRVYWLRRDPPIQSRCFSCPCHPW